MVCLSIGSLRRLAPVLCVWLIAGAALLGVHDAGAATGNGKARRPATAKSGPESRSGSTPRRPDGPPLKGPRHAAAADAEPTRTAASADASPGPAAGKETAKAPGKKASAPRHRRRGRVMRVAADTSRAIGGCASRCATGAQQRVARSLPRRAWDWLDHAADVLHLHSPGRRGGDRDWRATEERPFFEIVGNLIGVDLGLTVSEINRVAGTGGREFVHVVGRTGLTQNFELVLKRILLGKGQRLEVQGPAINTAMGLPIGFRLFGFGLTSDLFEPGQRRALSYTLEAKVTERTLLYLMPFWAPSIAAALEEGGRSVASDLVLGMVPFVSAGLAVQSGVRAVQIWRDPRALKSQKLLAVGHAAADVVRVFMPLVGTLANVGLVATSAAVSWVRVKAANSASFDDDTPAARLKAKIAERRRAEPRGARANRR